MGKSPLCSRHWKSDTSTWRILSEASFMMDQTLFGQKGDFLVPSSRRWLLIWPLPWKKQLNNSLIFKIRCSWKIWDGATWVVWRKYPLTHYNLRTCEMNGWAFTSCLLINTGFRLMEHDFWNTFFFPIKCSSLTLLALQYHNYTINIKKKKKKDK